ncbi:MAG: rod shape-determining protein MreD [Pseudomonadota bacterium]
MRPAALHRLDWLARSASPVAISLLLVILGMVPLQIPDVTPVIPAWALIAVYYWSVHRPDLMPIWAVFIIGLVQDLLGGGYPGVGILALLLVHQFVASQRRTFARASFQLLWLIFALIAAAAVALMWLLNCLLQQQLLEVDPALFQYLTTLAVYPCLAWLFAQAQRSFLS